MRKPNFKSTSIFIGIITTVFSWDTAYAANLCESATNHSISSASSSYDTGSRYVPSRAIDNKLSNWSRWSAKGKNESIVLDLGRSKSIDQVRTAWYKGDERSAYFHIDTSTNGSNWQRVLTNGKASGTKGLITFDVNSSYARYVKIIGRGNSKTDWNSLIEAKVIGCPDNSAPPPSSCGRYDNLDITRAFTSDSVDGSFTPSNAIDNNLSSTSRWSSKGVGNSMTVDLGQLSTVRRVSTAWYKGNVRQAFFDVQTSTNNSNWTTVLSGATAQGTLGMINFNVVESNARYVKIIGKGNSSSSWNSIVEMDVHGCGEPNTDEPTTTPEDPTESNDSIQLIRSLFDLEGGSNNLNPVNNNQMVFDALAARHVTPNGNGWRHEYKMAKENRRDMSDTSEEFAARITPELSDGAKTIVAQYHGGDTGTLVKIYVSDTNESSHNDSRANNGIFDVYGRVRTDDSSSETIINFGTIRSGESFDLVINNRRGLVYVSAMGVEETLRVSDSDGAYLKFGNYLQAQDAESGDDIDNSSDWADFYDDADITRARVTFSNINYVRY